MKFAVHYESKPGILERYSGVKTVEAENEDDAIEKAYRIIHRTFFDRQKNNWNFNVHMDGEADA